MQKTIYYNTARLRNSELIIRENGVTPIHSPTRSGKTQNYVKMSTDLIDKGCVSLHVTYDSGAALYDAKAKALNLGVPSDDIIFVTNKDGVSRLLCQLSGGERKKGYYYVMNGNHHHYNKIFYELKKDPQHYRQVPFCQFEDEAHWGEGPVDWNPNSVTDRELTAKGGRKKNMMQLHHLTRSHLFMTSATLERAMLDGTPNLLLTSSSYVQPTEASLYEMDSQESRRLREGLLSSERLAWVKHRANTQSQELILFNGVFTINAHEKLKDQLLSALPRRSDVCVLVIHKSKIIEYSPSKLVAKTLDVKDVQTAIEQLYHHDGYRYIYCIGHNQCELAQTFADHSGGIGLTVQFIACSANETDDLISAGIEFDEKGEPIKHTGYKMNWGSFAQWNRTGGYTTIGNQIVVTVKTKWDDYCAYFESYYDGIERYVDSLAKGEETTEILKELTFLLPDTQLIKPATAFPHKYSLSPKKRRNLISLTAFHDWDAVEREFGEDYQHIDADELKNRYGSDVVSGENPRRIDARKSAGTKTDPNRYSVINKDHGNIQLFDAGIRVIVNRWNKEIKRYEYHDHKGKQEWSNGIQPDIIIYDLENKIDKALVETVKENEIADNNDFKEQIIAMQDQMDQLRVELVKLKGIAAGKAM